MERAKVTGSKECLESVGIGEDIMGLEGTIKGYYPSGYVQIEIEHKIGKLSVINDFDIPSYWIEKIE